ncbi:MAG: glycosyltransferase family 4 protein [bacterium]
MQILYVVPWLFYPPLNTASEYHCELISALAQRGHKVFVVCFTNSGNGLSALQSKRIIIHDLPGSLVQLKSFDTTFRSIRKRAPFAIAKYGIPQLRDKILQILSSSEPPEVAFLAHIQVAQYAKMIERLGIPVLLHLHDIEAQKLQLLVKTSHSWFIKLGAWIESKRMQAYEFRTIRQTKTVCLSEHDRGLVRCHQPECEVGIVPLAINLKQYPFNILPGDGNEPIVFIGPADYYKNAAGVRWFLDRVYPHVLSLWPQARFRVVNVNPNSPLEQYIKKSPRTETVDFIKDVREELQKASVAIAPMVIASGVSGRVITQLALGIPTVATALACQGLDVQHGKHLWIADDPVEFARGVVSIAKGDPGQRAEMLANGRRYIEQKHDINQVAILLEQRLKQMHKGSEK